MPYNQEESCGRFLLVRFLYLLILVIGVTLAVLPGVVGGQDASPVVYVLRVDGTVRASSSITIGTISNSASLLLGAKSTSGGDQYQGLMDRAKISY